MSKEAKITADELKRALEGDLQGLLEETARAISEARAGAIIADSEEPVRAAVALFRQKLYERTVQLAADKAAQAALSPDGPCGEKGRLRNKGPQGVEHLTGNGIIRLSRRVYWRRGQGADDRLDRWLGIADSSVSVAARESCCQVSVAQASFTKSAAMLDRVGNIRVSKERMRQIVDRKSVV